MTDVAFKQMVQALKGMGFGGERYNELVGWRNIYNRDGTPKRPGNGNNEYNCEFCYQGHEDYRDIAHKDTCPVPLARAALAAIENTGF
jgi:hypothetical protein